MAQTTKIMLVEDDNNLGEIYMARMAAEGYSVVVAHDGEEALALAAKEKPDLIISDVMMPKISGFEMLDILRNTPGLRDTKVIMLTALGQAEDKTRAQSLGADRYLVKSQVTLEDIVENARALLSGEAAKAAAPTAQATATQPKVAQPAIPTPAATQPLIPAAPVTAAPTSTSAVPGASLTANTVPSADPPAGPTSLLAPAAQATELDTPAPIPVAEEGTSAVIGGLAEPLSAAPKATKEEPKTTSIADIAKPAAPVQNPPAPLPAPATPIATAPASSPIVAPVQPAPLAPPAAPPAPAPAPQPTPQPITTDSAAAQSNDQVLAGAVDELLANTPQSKTAPAPTEDAAAAPAPAPQPAVPPATPENKPTEHDGKVLDSGGNDITVGDNDSERVAHKKVIAPINDVTKKPDLNALLASEEAKNAGTDAVPSSGITTSNNGLQTTVVVPSGGNISGVTTTPTTSPPGTEAGPQDPLPPGSQNPNTAPPPTTSFDPNSVAL